MNNKTVFRYAFLLLALAALFANGAFAKQTKPAAKSAKVKPAANTPAEKPKVTTASKEASKPDADAMTTAEKQLTATGSFFREEGAHFENSYETWELLGDVTDQDGAKYDFAAFFSQAGGAYMNMRFGHVSFHPEGGEYFYSSMNPGVFLKAATNQLKIKLAAHPNDQKIKDALDRIEKKDTPHFELFDQVGDVFRTILYINYSKTHFIRVSRDSFVYSLGLSVQGNDIKAVLTADSSPVIFDNDNAIPTSLGENGFKGYTFPSLKISGVLVTADHKVKTITGRVRFAHLWGEPDKVTFSRFSAMLLSLDNGGEFYNFTFMLPDGAALSKQTFAADMNGAIKASPDSLVAEKEYWTSDLSGIKYPGKWTVKTPDFTGELSLSDTKHEFTILEGIGSFYFGPCDFHGTTADKNPKPVAGRGLCKLIAPDKP